MATAVEVGRRRRDLLRRIAKAPDTDALLERLRAYKAFTLTEENVRACKTTMSKVLATADEPESERELAAKLSDILGDGDEFHMCDYYILWKAGKLLRKYPPGVDVIGAVAKKAANSHTIKRPDLRGELELMSCDFIESLISPSPTLTAEDNGARRLDPSKLKELQKQLDNSHFDFDERERKYKVKQLKNHREGFSSIGSERARARSLRAVMLGT